MGVLREPVQGQTAVQFSIDVVVHPTQGGTGQSGRPPIRIDGNARVLHEHVPNQ